MGPGNKWALETFQGIFNFFVEVEACEAFPLPEVMAQLIIGSGSLPRFFNFCI